MRSSHLLALGVAASLLGISGAARADDAPALRVSGPCGDAASLATKLASLGVPLLADEGIVLDVRTRAFEARGLVEGELVVTDARGVVLARRFADRCGAVLDALTLAAAHAVEDAAAARRERGATDPHDAAVDMPAPPSEGSSTSSYWPAPAEAPQAKPKRVGEGGILLLGGGSYALGGAGMTTAKAFHGVAAWRIGRTRLGASASVGETVSTRIPTCITWAGEAPPVFGCSETSETSTTVRAGGAIGWGAPWNDGVAGFLVEPGVAWSHRVARPYLAWSLVLQVPIARSPVRPVAMLGGIAEPGSPTGALGMNGELGLVWQAF